MYALEIYSIVLFSLLQSCGASVKHAETFHGGTHNGTWTCYGYYDHINRFINYVSLGRLFVHGF